jgi:hypothetical protein
MRNNRLFLLVFALIAGLSSFAMTFYAAWENRSNSAPPPPDGLVALNDPLDLGDIPQDIIDGTFELVNHSKKPVKIVRIGHSCRCTQMEVTGNNIASGETVKIVFKWDTTGVRGVKGSSFTVLYSEEGREGLRSFPLSVQGNILPLFDLVPEKLEFTVRKTETKTIKLVPRKAGQSIILESCGSSLAAFKTEKVSDQELKVTFLPEKWIGDFGILSYISVNTNVENEKTTHFGVVVRK